MDKPWPSTDTRLKEKEDSPLQVSEAAGSADGLISDFWPWEHERINVRGHQSPVCSTCLARR